MNSHKNARLTLRGRELLVSRIVLEGLRPEEVAQALGVSVRTAYKWLARYKAEGWQGLCDRSSRPRACPHRTSETVCDRIIELRRKRMTYRNIARITGVSESSISRVLRQAGLNRLSALVPPRPENRYVREHPGDLLHLDIKKLGRFTRPGHRVTGSRKGRSRGEGWEYAHVAIDDASRVAHGSLHPNEQAYSACEALKAALHYYDALGIRIRRVMTDNGPCYHSNGFRDLCRKRGIKQVYTKPYTPRTNGKAERFIQTALHEWAYACEYQSSEERAAHLPHWLHQYNWHREHAGINYQTPISALGLSMNNLVTLHI